MTVRQAANLVNINFIEIKNFRQTLEMKKILKF